MKNSIKNHIEDPARLEELYQSDKKGFEEAFRDIYPEVAGSQAAEFWKTRLDYDKRKDDGIKIRKVDILFLIIACAVTGFLIKFPHLFDTGLSKDIFYAKNAALIVFFGLSFYAFLTKPLLKTRDVLIASSVFIISAIYMNLLPSNKDSHSIRLVFIHLPLMLWCLYGLIYIDFNTKDKTRRIDYIKYNGDLAVLGALILIAGGILTGITLGLFQAIDLTIEQFYFDNIVLVGLVSAPIVATFIIRKYPFVANKIAPIIARIFSPLVLITLIIYLISILTTDKDPYNDREFLLVFNLMLIGVMGIIVFSISETSGDKKQRFNEMTLFALSIITLIIDLIALTAILYRLGEYGLTPNRIAVLGSNLLIFGNLVLIMIDLFRVNFKNTEIEKVERTLASYLPVYALWTVFVVFVLPFLFGLK